MQWSPSMEILLGFSPLPSWRTYVCLLIKFIDRKKGKKHILFTLNFSFSFFLSLILILVSPLLVAVKVMLGHHLGKTLLFLLLFSHIWSIWSTDITTFQQQLISQPTDSFQRVAQALNAVGLYNPTRPWLGFYKP